MGGRYLPHLKEQVINMLKDKNSHLKAFSNGRIIFLDLEKNLYLISKSINVELAAKKSQEENTAKLRDNLRWPEDLTPTVNVIRNYIFSLFLSKKHRGKTIREQLNILALHSNTGGNKLIGDKEIREYSTLYQFIRNFRPVRPLCLEDSVCCFLFLSRYISDIELVIGVKYPPFKAHAWVESRNIILNDTKSAVEDYSVILRYGNDTKL